MHCMADKNIDILILLWHDEPQQWDGAGTPIGLSANLVYYYNTGT